VTQSGRVWEEGLMLVGGEQVHAMRRVKAHSTTGLVRSGYDSSRRDSQAEIEYDSSRMR